eukprot:NODE_3556_length_955_cov_28.256071_g3266_i0.p1 GENE.NODE_3556_length_955_cov_28.256071_g3266_i0~~NODE_3556_length_955_cov_28.256071_g3266_i0.p1  ORF type:complete len:253 (+),score=38.66 NODE_3556_length_955_cov_28.256071_g3266_i0:114-761(+)
MPRELVSSRCLVLGTAAMPIGLVGSSFLSLALWPPAGIVAVVAASALASGYSVAHVYDSQTNDERLYAVPFSPLCRLLAAIGLWNAYTPWAHQPFRASFKLFFYYTALSMVPAVSALNGGWQTWLWMLTAWWAACCFSAATMTCGGLLMATDETLVAPAWLWAVPTVRNSGRWLFENHLTHTSLIFAFYFAPLAIAFYVAYKWKYGVSASPYEAP